MLTDDTAFERAYHAAEMAALASAARAVFLSASQADPLCVAVSLEVRVEDGLAVIAGEFLDSEGQALGGFGL